MLFRIVIASFCDIAERGTGNRVDETVEFSKKSLNRSLKPRFFARRSTPDYVLCKARLFQTVAVEIQASINHEFAHLAVCGPFRDDFRVMLFDIHLRSKAVL